MNLTKAITAAAALALAAIVPSPARAEGFPNLNGEGSLIGVAWDPAVAIGDLRTTFGQRSLRGAQLHVRTALGRPATIGLAAGWNRFMLDRADGSTSDFAAYTLLATVHWYPPLGAVQPFLGLGVGGSRRNWTPSGSTYSDYSAVVDPELGVMITLDPGLALELALHYEFQTTRFVITEPDGRQKKAFPQWAGLRVGLALY